MGNRLETILQRIRDTWIVQAVNDVSDADLLRRFVQQRDAAAFELLLRRHERMVFAVCRQVMQDVTDAEDVFQATFLTLVRKAHSIARRESVAAWLHKVARRAARRAAALRARRLALERPTADLPAVAGESDHPLTHAHQSEVAPMLHEELSKLPDKYRAPLVLCYLEGKTYTEGALQLGCPLGTLSIRLKRGRDLLRKRLAGRGLVLTAGGLATALSEQTSTAATRAELLVCTLKAGLQVAGGSALGDVVSPQTAALTESMVQAMSVSKLKIATVALMLVLVVGLAVRGWARVQPAAPTLPEKPAQVEPKRGAAVEEAAFTIRGRVVDKAAKPVAHATVRLLVQGFNGLDVDETATTDDAGRFAIAAPKSWTRTDSSQRQELALVAAESGRLSVLQFSRTSAPPNGEVELTLSSASGDKIEILSPDLKPVAGAKVKISGLACDVIHVGFTEAELKQMGWSARKTPIGHVLRSGTVLLPPDLQVDIGATDARGLATVSRVATAGIGAVTVQSDEFGEQTVGHFGFNGKAPPNWARRIVLKRTGRVAGQLSGPTASAVAHRKVTLGSSEFNQATGMFHGSEAKFITDREGKFEAAKLVPGSVRYSVKFNPGEPTRAVQATTQPQLKAGQTLPLKIDLKPAVRVEGQVLEAESRKPIRDVQVRAFIGWGWESSTSDAEGKFVFWMAPGETALHPAIPEEYLSPLSPTDYFDQAKRQQTLPLFKVPEGKTFKAPPILLRRAVTLRGSVVDDRGQPLAGAGISAVSMTLERRTGQPKPREVEVRTGAHGEFAIAGLDPRESVRLRVTNSERSKVVTISRPGSEVVRIAMAAKEGLHIVGRVVDAEGEPVANPVLEIWHRDWRPPPHEAAPKKVSLKEPIRGDAQGRFKTPPLPADGHYRFTIRAGGVRTTESAWLDATKAETAKPQQLVVTRLSGVAGVVRDRAGKPVADAQITLVTRETRTETASTSQGQFNLETPSGRPFCVIVRHPDFRVEGAYYEKAPPGLDQRLIRLTEPPEKLTPRPLLAREERAKMLKQVFEPFKQRLAKSIDVQEKVRSLQSLTGVAPDFVTEFLDKNPLRSAMYNEMLRTQVAMKKASQNPEEAEELIGKMKQGSQKSMAYGMLVDALPEKARAHRLEILAEALVAARAEKSPAFRAVALGQVAKRLWMLGDKDRATPLLREGEKIARGLSTSGFAGYARGAFATELALVDLPAALALMKGLKDRGEHARHHGNTAHRIAAARPAEAVKILDMIGPPGPNEFNQRDEYAIRVCYRMAQADLRGALKLASSIIEVTSRAYALGVIAIAVAKTEPKRAADLVRRAFVLLEEDAARPDPPQLTGPLTQGAVAAALVLMVEHIDAALVRECLWRSVLLKRPHSEDPKQVWRYTSGNSALAMAAARYHGKLAEFLVPSGWAPWMSRGGLLAEFLANPQRTVAATDKAGKTKYDREVLLITYLATKEDGVPRLIFSTLGMWRIDVEDIDF
jgi:RNA polymerase sigma factor (sigma-70 family)